MMRFTVSFILLFFFRNIYVEVSCSFTIPSEDSSLLTDSSVFPQTKHGKRSLKAARYFGWLKNYFCKEKYF